MAMSTWARSFVRRLRASESGTGGPLRLLACSMGMGSRNASPRTRPLSLRPPLSSVTEAATNGALGGARHFSDGDKAKSPIRDEFLSSSDGEDGKLPTRDGLRSSTSVREGKLSARDEIPKVINPQLEPAVEEERDMKILYLVERRLRMSDKRAESNKPPEEKTPIPQQTPAIFEKRRLKRKAHQIDDEDEDTADLSEPDPSNAPKARRRLITDHST